LQVGYDPPRMSDAVLDIGYAEQHIRRENRDRSVPVRHGYDGLTPHESLCVFR
jgi:hypothetical protein